MSNQQSIAFIESFDQFPPTNEALSNPNGLLAASAQIDADWLQASYLKGVFPWYSAGEPVLWWSPNPRAVLYLKDFKLHRSLRKSIRKNAQNPDRKITLNWAFESVMRHCAQPRADGLGTWITEDIIQSYVQFHQRGLAHSVEHWDGDKLIGGLYCVGIGGMVFGESMFARETDASKIAFAHLVYWLKQHDLSIIDCQQSTRHLHSLGATTLTREKFESELKNALAERTIDWQPQILEWRNDAT
jgi:leucyl/phenylalanyl-tRNA---protein transferase